MNATLKKRVAITAIATMTLAMPFSAFASFGPDRPTFNCGSITHVCGGPGQVRFNSFTNNPNEGDERAFLTIRKVGGSYSDSVKLVPGQDYEVRAYVHNNADPAQTQDPEKLNAKNTTFKVDMPSEVNGSATIRGYISASNATPGTVYDDTSVTSDGKVKVNVVAGSARIASKGPVNGSALGDVTSGAILGYDSLDGLIPGCFNYAAEVTFKVHVSAPVTPPVTPPATPPVTPPATPATPTALPDTGPETALAGMAGTGALGYAVVAYRRSKKALAEKLLNRD